MKFNYLFLLVFIIALSSCSDPDETMTPTDTTTPLTDYFNLNIDGSEVSVVPFQGSFYGYKMTKKGEVFHLVAIHGESYEWFRLEFDFTEDGELISATKQSNSTQYGTVNFYNYRNFPSNYFNIQILSIDQTAKKIKLKFNGNLYVSTTDIYSEDIYLDADINIPYEEIENTSTNYIVDHYLVEQYCSAKLNNIPWIARHEHSNSSFTSEDPYKIEINFASSSVPGSYPFTTSSTSNYLKFSKFNTTTLTYDYYNVTGVVAHSYREFHGAARYSFIGTFSFTATNPNNPADVITVTDGVFRSFQQY
ncbi:MAG: hypothetical protein JNJ52_01680 [Flavobacterium sp.]|nr:hypothetical protein [Flavobacterium sp.]